MVFPSLPHIPRNPCPQNTLQKASGGQAGLAYHAGIIPFSDIQVKKKNLTRRHFIQASALALPWMVQGCASFNICRQDDAFVRVSDGRFRLHGQPHAYVGANAWYGAYLSDPALSGGRARWIRELDRLQALGVKNIRLLAGSETSALRGAIPRGITRSPHEYDENLLRGLDFCLAEMARRDMRAVLFLSNFWQWSGGFAQYVRWATGAPIPDPDQPQMAQGDWSAFMKFSATFYQQPKAVALYQEYIGTIIHRVNTVNGREYRKDTSIMTWELANEPRPGASEKDMQQSVPVFCQWVDRMARFIHAEDENHLVCTGSEGMWGCFQKPDVFIKAHQSPAIDYVTVHVWLKNWGWLEQIQLGPAFEVAAARARNHVEEHNKLAANVLHKPLVLEEFGLPRDGGTLAPGSPTTARDEYYRRMFQQVVQSCKAGSALQAANFWAWGGEGNACAPAYSSQAFLGDPPCEPQGLNSVMAEDSGTLQAIHQANAALNFLRG